MKLTLVTKIPNIQSIIPNKIDWNLLLNPLNTHTTSVRLYSQNRLGIV